MATDYPTRDGTGAIIIPANDPSLSPATKGEVATLVSSGIATAINGMLSDATPATEATGGKPGTATKATREGHQHPRLTSVRPSTTDANGRAILTFTRQFAAPPGVVCTAVENDTQSPPTFKVMRWLKQDGTTWTSSADGLIYGAEVYADRNRTLPTLTAIVLLTALLSALSQYSTRIPAANVPFQHIAVEQSTPT